MVPSPPTQHRKLTLLLQGVLVLRQNCVVKKKRCWLKVFFVLFFLPTGHQIAVDPETTHIPRKPIGVEVSGSTMGIIGMGHIGHKIAQRGKGFDMKILYHNRSRRSLFDLSDLIF